MRRTSRADRKQIWFRSVFVVLLGVLGLPIVGGVLFNPPAALAASTGQQFAVGLGHTCTVDAAEVWCWGSNTSGELGDGLVGNSAVSAPRKVLGLNQVTAVSAGLNFTCALKADGTIKCWGTNLYGQLGNGTITNSATPVNVSGINTATAIAVGGLHACALLADSTIRCWGHNGYGQLGFGSFTTNSSIPVAVLGINSATAISVGLLHSCALLADQSLRCWGNNDNGQLGNGTLALNASPSAVLGITSALAVTAGESHTCARLVDATARCWGSNSSGQLGITSGALFANTPEVVFGATMVAAIAAGSNHSCAAFTNQTVSCWGNNAYGQLGDQTFQSRSTATAVPGLTGVTELSAWNHTCARSTAGIRCWGRNVNAQLGTGSRKDTPNPMPTFRARLAVVTGDYSSCALRPDRTVWCWGTNHDFGQLGNGTNIDSPVPVQVVGISSAVGVTAGVAHTCAVLADGTVKCWGWNLNGQLGNGTNADSWVPVTVPGITNATAISAGSLHTCVLLANATVKCWGSNVTGQLGNGTFTTSTTPVAVNLTDATAIIAGSGHSCALLANENVTCWGANTLGQLGNGTNAASTTPVTVTGISARSLSGFGLHNCAVLVDGTVRCWGSNVSGQLGNGTIVSSSTPVAVTGINNAIAVSAGRHHSCALLTSTTLKCWGANGFGRLGNGTANNSSIPVAVLSEIGVHNISAGGYHTCSMNSAGTVHCWGSGTLGELGNGLFADSALPVTAIFAADSTPPTGAIITPAANSVIANPPVAISGSAADNQAVEAVRVAIYRSILGSQYWNGTAWQTTFTLNEATLTNPGSTSTNWATSLPPPNRGIFAIAVIVYDYSGNYTVIPYQLFTVADTIAPAVTMTAPTPSQAFLSGPISIAGNATDNAAIAQVQVYVYRSVGTGQYWTGTAWQSAYASVNATLTAPGTANTGYSYTFDPPIYGGYYYVAAVAVDTSGLYTVAPYRLFTVLETAPPAITVAVNPLSATAATTRTINGTATDNSGVLSTAIYIYRASDQTFWNGATWQPGFTYIAASTATPGATSSTYTASWTPSATGAGPGIYYVGSFAYDTSYNYAFSTGVAVTVT
jgi:alpha-tubulin suppressor-like RCC1 family protein